MADISRPAADNRCLSYFSEWCKLINFIQLYASELNWSEPVILFTHKCLMYMHCVLFQLHVDAQTKKYNYRDVQRLFNRKYSKFLYNTVKLSIRLQMSTDC